MAFLTNFLAYQSLAFVVAAAAICAVSGWLIAHLSRRAEAIPSVGKPWWLAGTAVIAGTGVWTTHFIAMLGYRTDYVIGYDLEITLISAVAAVFAVGVPFAASSVVRRATSRAALGAVAGLGIGAMHLIGMAAIRGCTQTQSFWVNVVACLIGASSLALARGLPARLRRTSVTTALFVLAVCGVHFVSIAGTTLVGQASESLSHIQIGLSLLTAGATAILLCFACFALVTAWRFEVLDQTHAAALATALQNMSNGILKLSASGAVEIYNRRLLGMLRLQPYDLAIGMTLDQFLNNVGRANGWTTPRIRSVIDTHRGWMAKIGETRIEHVFEDGRILMIVCQPVPDGAVLTYEDVSSARQAQREITHLAYHDALTGLQNRRSLHERMQRGFVDQRRFKLLLLDLDRFKFVNDTYGHSAGDRLLQQVANRLNGFAGEDVFVARLGGDEMALLVYGDNELAQSVAARILEEISRPYVFEDFTLVIGVSIGLCCTDDASDPDDLMQRSDLALYEAKRNGRGRFVCYSPGMIEAVTERTHLEADMRLAALRGQFHLVYQPLKSLETNRIFGYEALIRWRHPTRGSVSPVTFIPLAEETGLINAIGRWVLEEACRQALLWPVDQNVAVNVSAVQLRSQSFLADVKAVLAASGLPAHRLEIELTETALVEDGRQMAQTLAGLRDLGITIAMDDFGTGYSSLAHLRDLPLDRIKIDRSFVSTAVEDPHSRAVIRAITQMARDMGIATIAEGVETTEQLDLLRTLGCGAVQGFLIGRPARPATNRMDLPVRKVG